MTPDEVVTRARELEGREVLLTVRTILGIGGVDSWNRRPVSGSTINLEDLVDIRPAPMRIVAGQRYADNAGRLYEGDSDGGLWELAAGYLDAGDVGGLDGLHAVKVVPA